MRVNPKKSSSIRFVARFSVKCSNNNVNCMSWSDNVRYLWTYLRSSRTFACSFSHAKQSMYRAFNAVCGKVGRIASPDVVIKPVRTKCLSTLCYGIDVCPVDKSDIGSFQYVVVDKRIFFYKNSAYLKIPYANVAK